jgi:hypothetical protein
MAPAIFHGAYWTIDFRLTDIQALRPVEFSEFYLPIEIWQTTSPTCCLADVRLQLCEKFLMAWGWSASEAQRGTESWPVGLA